MKATRLLTLVVLVASTAMVPAARAGDHPATPGDIVAVASSAGNFQTLVAAIEAADLVETLQGKGPFTVFAPTDDAFAKLPPGTLEDLLKPANKAKLAGILACHVVPGKVMAADVKTMQVKTVQGRELNLRVADGKVTVDGAKVVATDLAAANGVIHAIDAVILPTDSAGNPATAKPKDHPGH